MPATTLGTDERTLAALRSHARVVEQILNSVLILDGVPRAPSGTASRHKLPLVFSIPDHTICFHRSAPGCSSEGAETQRIHRLDHFLASMVDLELVQ
jgi:hypothetical protein